MKLKILMLTLFLSMIQLSHAQSILNNGWYQTRSDMKDYIDQLPDNIEQKKSLEQMVRSFNHIFSINLNNKEQVKLASLKMKQAINCVYSRYSPNVAAQRSSVIERLYVNKKEYRKLYTLYNKSLSGTVSSIPEGNTCE